MFKNFVFFTSNLIIEFSLLPFYKPFVEWVLILMFFCVKFHCFSQDGSSIFFIVTVTEHFLFQCFLQLESTLSFCWDLSTEEVVESYLVHYHDVIVTRDSYFLDCSGARYGVSANLLFLAFLLHLRQPRLVYVLIKTLGWLERKHCYGRRTIYSW